MNKMNTTNKGWQECQLSSLVNNQMGVLHNYVTNETRQDLSHIKQIQPVKLIQNITLPNLFIAQNVMEIEFIKYVRQFINQVVFDKIKPIINDFNNLPLSNAWSVNDFNDLNNIRSTSNDWIWEHYSHAFWRLTPKTLNAFVNSPVFQLITVLEDSIRRIKTFDGIELSSLKKGTWVIQRMEQGDECAIHSDAGYNRIISFVYYLTPDDWDKLDGGGFCLLDVQEKCFKRINPTFNSLIMWKSDDPYLRHIHYVEKIKTNKSRIALVGFFNKS